MAKRKLSPEYESDASHFSVSDDDDSYASDQPKPRKKITSHRKTSKKRIKRETNAPNDISSVAAPHPKSTHTIPRADVSTIRAGLLRWYSTVHDSRNMPWRKQYDPTLGPEERAQRAYEVWISEIMLQQTQVATVIPYYNRWMEKHPPTRYQADASIDEVNSLWKGLGYYSRASRLLSGAQKAVKDYGGKLPDNAKDMQANIPGIGRYSAGAICSIAYGESVPVLDGNVNRLLSRFLALHAPPKAKAALDILWSAAEAMVHDLASAEYPGDINQALIELGSTVCKVRDPNCEGCPLQSHCSAYAATSQPTNPVVDMEDLCKLCEPLPDSPVVTAYPMKADKKKAREELDIVNVVEWRSGSDRQFLLVRRPEGGLLAGLDEFPTCPNVAPSMTKARQLKTPHDVLQKLLHANVRLQNEKSSLKIAKVQPVGDVVHVFSHIKKTYRVQWVVLEGTSSPPELAPPAKGKGKKDAEQVLASWWVPLDAVSQRNIGTGVLKPRYLTREMSEHRFRLYTILNLSTSATDAEIHERHRNLALTFHPDRQHTEETKSVANERFLEIQKAYQGTPSRGKFEKQHFLLPALIFQFCLIRFFGRCTIPWVSSCRVDEQAFPVNFALGEPGLAVNWLEEHRTQRSEELQQIFKKVEYEWMQDRVRATISPRGRVVCKADASSLFAPYQGLEGDSWSRRLGNRLEDVRLLSFSLRHEIEVLSTLGPCNPFHFSLTRAQQRINAHTTASLAARLSRRGLTGRGNFVGTLRYQYSPRLAFQATSMLLYPYDISLRSGYQTRRGAVSVQGKFTPGKLADPLLFISVSRKFSRGPDSLEGRLTVDLGRQPEVSLSFASQDLPLHGDIFASPLPLAHMACSWSRGLVLNPFDPKVFVDWVFMFSELSMQCKLGIEYGLDGFAWLLSGSWFSQDARAGATIRLSINGVVLTVDAEYLQQQLCVPILLLEQHSTPIALWASAVPCAFFASVYHIRARNFHRKRLRAIRSALRNLEPDSPLRRDAEAVISLMRDRVRDFLEVEIEKGGLVIVDATYGPIQNSDRDMGLSWNVTLALQALVRGSQLHIPGRHPKPSIQGFLDPAPFAPKSLRIYYLFGARPHYVEVPDYISLVLPLRGHVVE
ncbi:hypothetical protein FB45DRAFT_1001978 [Roridomyces roridus]|uniref:Adenine DNA glycosylase n=1 Tax=Roridomyces roridus TaxID=1738132 RepID=A0AAD7C2K0_9AGAR|nr:hypothetical protein FB45DRAFT_1001978 [Roridomyces roridus]